MLKASLSPSAGSGRACAPSLSSPWPSRWPAGPAAHSKQQGAPVDSRVGKVRRFQKTPQKAPTRMRSLSPAQPVFSCRGRSHPGCCILAGTACTGRAWRTTSTEADMRMQSHMKTIHTEMMKFTLRWWKGRMRLTASRISNFFLAWRTLICQKKHVFISFCPCDWNNRLLLLLLLGNVSKESAVKLSSAQLLLLPVSGTFRIL